MISFNQTETNWWCFYSRKLCGFVCQHLEGKFESSLMISTDKVLKVFLFFFDTLKRYKNCFVDNVRLPPQSLFILVIPNDTQFNPEINVNDNKHSINNNNHRRRSFIVLIFLFGSVIKFQMIFQWKNYEEVTRRRNVCMHYSFICFLVHSTILFFDLMIFKHFSSARHQLSCSYNVFNLHFV